MTTINHHHHPASARLASTSTTPKAKSSRRSQSVQYTTMALKKWTDTASAEEDSPGAVTSPAAWRTHNRGVSSGDNNGWFGLSELSPVSGAPAIALTPAQPGTPSDTGILHRKLKEKEAEIIRVGVDVWTRVTCLLHVPCAGMQERFENRVATTHGRADARSSVTRFQSCARSSQFALRRRTSIA